MKFETVKSSSPLTGADLAQFSHDYNNSYIYRVPTTHPKVLYVRHILKPPSPPRIPRDTLQPKHGLISSREPKSSTACTTPYCSSLTTERIYTHKTDVKLNISNNQLLRRRNR